MARRAASLAVANGVSKLLLVGFEALLATKEGTRTLGLYAICQSLLLVVGMLALAGTDMGVVRFLGIRQEQGDQAGVRRLVQATWIVALAVSVLAGGALLVAREWFASSVFHEATLASPLFWIALALPLEAFNQASGAVFRGLRREVSYVVTTDLVRHVVLAITVVAFAGIRSDVTRLSQILFVSNVVSAVYGVTGLRRNVRRVPGLHPERALWPELRELVGFSSVLFLWNVIQNIAGRLQILLASLFVGPSDVGVFNLFLRLVLVLTFAQSVVNNTAAVEFARLDYLHEPRRLRDLYQRASTGLAVVAGMLLVPVLASPSGSLRWLGAAAEQAATLAVPLLVVQAFNVATGPMGNLLVSCGVRFPVLAISAVGAVVEISMYVALGSRYELAGVVAAECLTVTVLVLARQAVGWRRLAVHGFTRHLVLVAAGTALCAVLARAVAATASNVVSAEVAAPLVGSTLAVCAAALFFMQVRTRAARRPYQDSVVS